MNTRPAQVDLAFTAVLDRRGGSRLVLRRRVGARADDGHEVSVEQLWVSRPHPSPLDTARLVRDVTASCGRHLVSGRPVGALPGLENPAPAQLVELSQATEKRAVDVEYLAGYRGTVEDLWDGRPVLRAGDVVASDGFLGVRTGQRLGDVLRDLVPPAADGAPAGRPLDECTDGSRARTDLLRDLADARLRLDQARAWALLAAAHLGFVYGCALAAGWSRAVRRTPDGTPVESDGAPDAIVAIFVHGRGGQVDLFRYPLDPGLDLPGVLADPRVERAFAACAADPGDSLGQARAVAALRGTTAGRATPDGGPDPGVPVTGLLVATVEPLDGVVVLHDCREIIVGNDERRFTTAAHVFTPRAATGDLLRTRPEIVEAIVERSCAVDDTAGGRLRTALAAAVCAEPGRP